MTQNGMPTYDDSKYASADEAAEAEMTTTQTMNWARGAYWGAQRVHVVRDRETSALCGAPVDYQYMDPRDFTPVRPGTSSGLNGTWARQNGCKRCISRAK